MPVDVLYPCEQDLFRTDKSVPQEGTAAFRTEQALLSMVRMGDLNYKQAFNNAAMISSGMRIAGVDSLRQSKISVSVFAALCARAAIEGGMLPETAHTLANACIANIEKSRTISDIATCAYAMYSDFVERVHRGKSNENLSPQIRSVCDYIQLNLEKPLTTKEIAKRIGYADYYLTKKFKSEMGITLTEYIQNARIEAAKMLLTTTDHSIQVISDRLQFTTRSYFGVVFHKYTGMAPAEYRTRNKPA